MPPIADLEDLVRHLSGRGAQGRGGAAPLDPPTGEMAQVLDEIRRRTRALLDDPDDPDGPSGSAPVAPPSRPLVGVNSPGSRRRTALVALCLALLGGLGGIAADRAWLASGRPVGATPDPEVRQALAVIQTRLAAPAVPTAAPNSALIDLGTRLEAHLAALGTRLDHLDQAQAQAQARDRDRPAAALIAARPAGAPDPTLAAISADLAVIRREQSSSEQATARQVQGMRSLLEQVNTEVRRVLARPEPSSSTTLAPILALTVQALVHNLQHPSAQVRGEAVEQLARLGPSARTAIPALRDRFARESDPNVRTVIETALTILTSN